MILAASFPADVSATEVEAVLTGRTSSRVMVELAEEALTETEDSDQVYVLSAVGQDRVGLVAQVSRFCCDRGINILDLASHVDGDQYTMMLQVDLSQIRSLRLFEEELSAFGKTSGLNLVLQHNEIFRVTNEI
jgi:glycine cleavage system regulatory protein